MERQNDRAIENKSIRAKGDLIGLVIVGVVSYDVI